MIKYDAHMCHHELTNQIDQSNVDNRDNIHSCDWLQYMLPMQNAIKIELTLLSIDRFDNHIEHILSDYPSIKKIHIYVEYTVKYCNFILYQLELIQEL